MHLSVFLSRKRLGLNRKCGTIGFNFQKNLEMWEHRTVGTSGLLFQNKSGNIALWEHRAQFSKLSVKKKSLEMWEHRAVGTLGCGNIGLWEHRHAPRKTPVSMLAGGHTVACVESGVCVCHIMFSECSMHRILCLIIQF